MSKSCEVCGKGLVFGKTYSRRGLARAKGGAGQKITGKAPRTFSPNIQRVKVLTDKGGVKRIKVCTECIKRGRIKKAVGAGKRDLSAKGS